MFTLYSMQRSGNSYKARLALAQLHIPYRLIEIDILKGESHTPEFLAKNPNGQVPLLEVAPGRYLAESNAILWYIAGGTPMAPEDRIDRAEILQWMFFEQHSLEPNLGAAYFSKRAFESAVSAYQHALELDPDVFDRTSRDGVQAQLPSPEDRARYDYTVAKLYAKMGFSDQSLEYLRKAMEAGYKDLKNVYKDAEFVELRKNPRFTELMASNTAAISN